MRTVTVGPAGATIPPNLGLDEEGPTTAAAVATGRGMLRLAGVRAAGLLPSFVLGVVPAMALTIGSRMAWWGGAELGGWALFAAVCGALLEGALWTVGAGAGVLTWLRRQAPSVTAPPVSPDPPDASPVAMHV